MKEKNTKIIDEIETNNKVFNVKENIFKSKKFLGYNKVQYNIWEIGNIKLRKKIKKQKQKAKIAAKPLSFIFSLFLTPPWSGEWYFAFFLDKFSRTNKAKIKIKMIIDLKKLGHQMLTMSYI